MAEDDPRVHKASEVHQRRAPRKARPGEAAVKRASGLAGSGAGPKRGGADGSEAPGFRGAAGAGAAGAAGTGGGNGPSEPVASRPEPGSAADPGRGAEPGSGAESGPGSKPGSGPEAGPDRGPEAEPAPTSEPGPDRTRKRWGLRIAVGAACLIAAGALVFAGFAAGSRWLRYNDAHDMQGTWYVSGTDVPIAFTDSSIDFDANTSYAYEIDPQAKTISYSLGSLEGHGRYWFSDDRATLVITDGDGFTMWSTLLDDLAHAAGAFLGDGGLPAGEGSIVLTRAITLPSAAEPPAADEAPGQLAEDAGDQAGGSDDFGNLAISDVLMKDDAGDGDDDGAYEYGYDYEEG